MSLFTRLPAELIRTILDTLDPTSFYLCLQTSKLFREHAFASTKLLRDQLSRIPGQRVLPARMAYKANDANALMIMFSTRAKKHLACGAEWMSDKKMWMNGAKNQVDRKASQLVLWGSRSVPNKRVVLFEVMEDATVNVYIVSHEEEKEMLYKVDREENKRTLKREFVPILKHIISPNHLSELLSVCSLCNTRWKEYKVVKIAQCPYSPQPGPREEENGNLMVGVLYRGRSSSCRCNPQKMKLLVFRLDPSFGPVIVEAFDVLVQMDDHIVAMELTRTTEAILVVAYGHFGIHRVMAYRIEVDEDTLERRTIVSSQPLISTRHERIANVSISDYNQAVHLFSTAFPMPQWTIPFRALEASQAQEGIRTPDTYVRRDTLLPDIVDVFLKHSLGRAIACHHHHQITLPTAIDGPPICVNTALELVISNEDHFMGSRKGAFLLKALEFPEHCKGFELRTDYDSLQHVFVAQLAGLPQLDNLSTLGLIVAVSPHAYRIAIASWRTLKVWSLDPQAFLEPGYSLGGGEGVPDDYAFIEGCGWQFYSSEPIYRDCIMLSPVELPNSAVIFALEFRAENELWGWTERGLCRWEFGPSAQGRKEEDFLNDV